MDKLYEKKFAVSSLLVAQVRCFDVSIAHISLIVVNLSLMKQETCLKLEAEGKVFILCLFFSLLTIYHLDRKSIKQTTTFTSKRSHTLSASVSASV